LREVGFGVLGFGSLRRGVLSYVLADEVSFVLLGWVEVSFVEVSYDLAEMFWSVLVCYVGVRCVGFCLD